MSQSNWDIRMKLPSNYLLNLSAITCFVAALCTPKLSFAADDWDFAASHKSACSTGTQLEMNLCMEKHRKAIERTLAEKTASLEAALLKPKQIRAAQTAWENFKNAECRFSLSGLEEGDGVYQFALHACVIDLTEKRLRDITSHLSNDCNGCPPRRAK